MYLPRPGGHGYAAALLCSHVELPGTHMGDQQCHTVTSLKGKIPDDREALMSFMPKKVPWPGTHAPYYGVHTTPRHGSCPFTYRNALCSSRKPQTSTIHVTATSTAEILPEQACLEKACLQLPTCLPRASLRGMFGCLRRSKGEMQSHRIVQPWRQR